MDGPSYRDAFLTEACKNLEDEAENGDFADCFALESFLQIFVERSESKRIKDRNCEKGRGQNAEDRTQRETPNGKTTFENLRMGVSVSVLNFNYTTRERAKCVSEPLNSGASGSS